MEIPVETLHFPLRSNSNVLGRETKTQEFEVAVVTGGKAGIRIGR